MMRRSVWEAVKWDPQFKTGLEHSDFFLRLKYRSDRNHMPVFRDGMHVLRKKPIKVAYTPDVWMYHRRFSQNAEYNQYRMRLVGWQLFGDKWRVDFCNSSFNNVNPISFKDRHSSHSTIHSVKDENLKLAIRILEGHGCKWWLEAGTCLGAVRQRAFITYDPDIDIGLPEKYLKLWDVFIKEFK